MVFDDFLRLFAPLVVRDTVTDISPAFQILRHGRNTDAPGHSAPAQCRRIDQEIKGWRVLRR